MVFGGSSSNVSGLYCLGGSLDVVGDVNQIFRLYQQTLVFCAISLLPERISITLPKSECVAFLKHKPHVSL